jgi:hypothetical protein
MKNRINFRINKHIENLLTVWKEQPQTRLHDTTGKPLSIATQIATGVRHLIRSWLQNAISAKEIKQLAQLGKDRTGFYRVDLPSQLHTLTISLIRDTSLTLSEIVRASVVLLPDLTQRAQLEQDYLARGGVGDPELMSDDFLLLWVRHRNEGPATDGVYIVRALRDLEIKFQSTLKKLDRLEVIFDNYGIEGILKSEKIPMKKTVLCLEGRGLRTLCKRWKIPAPSQTPDENLRRMVLSHFGYQQEI